MKLIKHLINGTVWSLLALYLLLLIASRLPVCQEFAGSKIASVLSKQLGTEVSVGRIDIGLLNRLILDDVCIKDQQQQEMLRISRLTARVGLRALAKGKIYIASAQLFGAQANLYQKSGQDKPNYQFVIDSLASKDTTSHTPLNLRINSLIIRHSGIRYDKLSEPETPGLLNPNHLNVNEISAHLILRTLTDDSLDLNIKRLGLQEQSGLTINRLSMKLKADKHAASLRGLLLEMPSTTLKIDSADATYQWTEKGLEKQSLTYSGFISETSITPSDLRCFHQPLKNLQRPVKLSTSISGTWEHLDVPQLNIYTDAGDIRLKANGYIDGLSAPTPQWRLNTNQLELADNIIDFLQKSIGLPPMVKNLGNLQLSGTFGGEHNGNISANAVIKTSIGQVTTNFTMTRDRQFNGSLRTTELNLQRLTGDAQLGTLSADLKASGAMPQRQKPSIRLEGAVTQIDYNNYPFRNITINGSYANGSIAGLLQIADPNVDAELNGEVALVQNKVNSINIDGDVRRLSPQALNLTNRWDDAVFSGKINANFKARTLKDAEGQIRISQLSMKKGDTSIYQLDQLLVMADHTDNGQHLTLVSDFAKIDLKGDFEYETLPRSIANIVGSKLPELPGLPPLTNNANNNFSLRMQVYKSDWLQRLLGVDLDIVQTAIINARVNDKNRTMILEGDLPRLAYNGATYTNGKIEIHALTPMDTLRCNVSASRISENEHLNISLSAQAIDNNLKTSLNWNDGQGTNHMSGELNTITRLYTNLAQKPEAHVRIQPSHIILNDTIWNVEPSDILYSENNLLVDHFNIHHDKQHITIDGKASKHPYDSLTIDLNEVEVAYILDLVNFHTVEFSGKATGKAIARSLFNNFEAHTDLQVGNFKFEKGRMGTLHAHAEWNREQEQIDIKAIADDGPDAITHINGYVSPTHNTINLAFGARGTYVDFMHNFTNSFLSYITGHAEGDLRLAGTLDNINLTGKLEVEGKAFVTALNTEYELHKDTIVFIPDEIELRGIPLSDRYGNTATLSGGIHHEHLTNLTFDLFVNADNLLAYDFRDFGESNFYGTVFASGNVAIKGRPGEVTIDCDVTPQKNTVFVYNASSPDAISKQEFIQWGSASKAGLLGLSRLSGTSGSTPVEPDEPTDIYINFLINCTPDATMRLLMDANTNDYITLNGEGAIRATFYNKGPFNMFGTYTVEHGTYGVTIQNIIQKNFTFNRGGTIVFGGDPYNAALNLQALYTVNGVSLSDLNIGNSFASNTIRVNCLMNIGGQPNSPQVDFDLEMPTVNADEQQMVRSVINGQQEMNQQVLYLLAIGRFYNQTQNNADAQQQDQTSLAMQSFLSGTLSTQINNLLNTVIKNDNWNIGANISTGNEGWHNAEYEGIISGRMLNNRLLLNGQFGYRDNAKQATPSFIGDFDIQYLLFPNGNLSVKMYNQTNDRYFTKSSLNTQGIGLLMKKDFNGLGDLFSTSKKKRKKSNKKSITPVSSQ